MCARLRLFKLSSHTTIAPIVPKIEETDRCRVFTMPVRSIAVRASGVGPGRHLARARTPDRIPDTPTTKRSRGIDSIGVRSSAFDFPSGFFPLLLRSGHVSSQGHLGFACVPHSSIAARELLGCWHRSAHPTLDGVAMQICDLGEFGQLEIVERRIRATQQDAEGCANFGCWD